MDVVQARVDAVDAIHRLLPQTQCQRCGYPDCRSYAEAIQRGAADINQCPPGGEEGVRRLAAWLGRTPKPLNPVHGHEGPLRLAHIVAERCIGCTLCLGVCPTDAIVGANRQLHVVVQSDCTGCELCLPACPVDCIDMVEATPDRHGWQAWSQPQADAALAAYTRRHERRQRLQDQQHVEQLSQQQAMQQSRKARVEAALVRARQQLGEVKT